MNIAVLGTGMVGRAIAIDLSVEHTVTCFDIDITNLEQLKKETPSVNIVSCDLSSFNKYQDLLFPFDLVVTAVPGFMGYRTLEATINAGKNAVDISFFPENASLLTALAKAKNVTVVYDCGVAPGMSNLILGRYNEEIRIHSFSCYVGGLPVERKLPFQYKAPFSPVDVIQEYIRPARLKENGSIVIKEALSDRELLYFDKIGELEAFNTDGLRSLLETMGHIPEMKEKTLRYPGHADLVESLKRSGFFDTEPVRINGIDIRPLDLTSELLIKQWKLEPGEKEFTVMRVEIEGEGRKIEYELLDYYDEASATSSMARTTGFTCTAVVDLIAKGKFREKGIFPPEFVGKDSVCFEHVIGYLQARGVNWKKKSQ